MKTSILTLSLSASLLAALGGVATAQPRADEGEEIPVPTNAIEISIASTYLQGAGDYGSTMSNIDANLAPGFGGELGVGVRVTDNLAIGGYASLAGFSDGAVNDHVAIGSLGLKADWHFQPRRSVDPWISLGAGVKELWVGNRDTFDSQLLGVELVRFQAGVDYRIAPSVSIGPSASVSATMFTHQKTSIMDDYAELDDKDVNLLITAGLVGRFDFGPTR